MIRPDDLNNCPSGTQKCSILTDKDHSVCVSDRNDCPINDLEFVATSSARASDSYWETTLSYANDYSLRFTTQGDMNPIISTKTGLDTPCMKPSETNIS
jgi:hypothetical protein